MTDLFAEVDEDLRREKLEKQWKRYGPWLISAVVLIILASAGFTFWNKYQRDWREEVGDSYFQAISLMDRGETEEARRRLTAVAETGHDSYQVLARLELAAQAARDGQSERAQALYRQIREEGKGSPYFQDLALLFSVMERLRLGPAAQEEAEGGSDSEAASAPTVPSYDPQAILAELEPLLSDDNPWRYSAREIAALMALETGEQRRAERLIQGLADDLQAPNGVRARASELLSAIGSAQTPGADTEETASEERGAAQTEAEAPAAAAAEGTENAPEQTPATEATDPAEATNATETTDVPPVAGD